MCEVLSIKIAIIKRSWLRSNANVSTEAIASGMLGCKVSEQIVNYVVKRSNKQIEADIYKGNTIALALDNLKPDWLTH